VRTLHLTAAVLLGALVNVAIACGNSNSSSGSGGASTASGASGGGGREGTGGDKPDGRATGGGGADAGPPCLDPPLDAGVDPFEEYDAGPPVTAKTDAEGWSVLPGMPGTAGGYSRAIYVDSVKGNESNTGASPSSALQGIGTSSKLNSLLENAPAGQSIVVVLKPGSSWTTSPADQLNPPIGGSAAHPLLITGSRWPNATGARPRIGGMIYLGHSHVAIEGLEIGPGNVSGFGEGIHIPSGGETDFLIEDNLITNYTMNIEITGSQTTPVTNVRIRRNYIFGACGGGAVVGFDGNDVAAMLFEDNFFDYNGGPSNDCNYVNSTEARTSNINPLAHDIYFADDSVRVVALDVTFRHNAFTRTLQSVKGAYTGTMDDNLFYNYWSGGYIGTWGGTFSNNVLIDGGGFGTALDNNHSPNEIACRTTRFCTNLFYNEGSPYTPDVYAFTAQNAAGVNLVFDNNVIDGLDRAFEFNDSTCFAYDVTDNIVQTNSFYEFYQPWPRASCPASFSDNQYHSPQGDMSASASGYGLELPGTSPQYQDFVAAEAYIHEQHGVYRSSAFPFDHPKRNLASYLVEQGLASASPPPTLLTYLSLVQTQAKVPHRWNPALSVKAINEYLRAGHALPDKPLAYGSGCP
jgi:hypothetical protein